MLNLFFDLLILDLTDNLSTLQRLQVMLSERLLLIGGKESLVEIQLLNWIFWLKYFDIFFELGHLVCGFFDLLLEFEMFLQVDALTQCLVETIIKTGDQWRFGIEGTLGSLILELSLCRT